MRMPELKARVSERGLRGYSRLRKPESIAFPKNNENRAQGRQRPPPPPPQMSTWEPNRPPQASTWEPKRGPQQPELERLTKRQLKRRQNKDSTVAKRFKYLEKENDNLKSQMEEQEDKITKASKSINERFKRKKIRSMKCEADKIAEALRKSEATLKLLEPRLPKAPRGAPLNLHPPNRNKHIEAKIAELNKKIRRAKNRRNKECLIAKRNSLRLDLNWGPRHLDRAFGGAYRHYRTEGIEGMDVATFSLEPRNS